MRGVVNGGLNSGALQSYFGTGADGDLVIDMSNLSFTPTKTYNAAATNTAVLSDGQLNATTGSAGFTLQVADVYLALASYDFGRPASITQWVLSECRSDVNSGISIMNVQIEWSADNTNWNLYQPAQSTGQFQSGTTLYFYGHATARYWRVMATQPSGTSRASYMYMSEIGYTFVNKYFYKPIAVGPTKAVVINANTFTLNNGTQIEASEPCAGIIIFSKGAVTLNGNISMSNNGWGPGIGLHIPEMGAIGQIADLSALYGGIGGNGGENGNGNMSQIYIYGGTAGGKRVGIGGFGGGGAGGGGIGTYNSQYGGKGGDIPFPEMGQGVTPNQAPYGGTNYGTPGNNGNNGSGGAGVSMGNTTYTGQGGNGGRSYGAGGGGGGGAGASTQYSTGSNGTDGGYTGGGIFIIAAGDITIGAGRTLESKGGNGGNGAVGSSNGTQTLYGGGGGGAGGGVIAFLYGGTLSNSGTLNVNGGLGGSANPSLGGNPGQAGQIGTIYSKKIA
jgi:hypothetical protein